jgi:hypothetical protein
MGCYGHEFRHALHFLLAIDGHIKNATNSQCVCYNIWALSARD